MHLWCNLTRWPQVFVLCSLMVWTDFLEWRTLFFWPCWLFVYIKHLQGQKTFINNCHTVTEHIALYRTGFSPRCDVYKYVYSMHLIGYFSNRNTRFVDFSTFHQNCFFYFFFCYARYCCNHYYLYQCSVDNKSPEIWLLLGLVLLLWSIYQFIHSCVT